MRSSIADALTRDDVLLNQEGSIAFRHDARATLVNMAATCVFSETLFYGDTWQEIDQPIREIGASHPDWLMKLAVWLREQQQLRAIPARMLALGATMQSCRPYVQAAFSRVCRRPDDLLYIAEQVKDARGGLCNGSPHVIRTCIAQELAQLSEWHAIKYRKGQHFGLKHLLQLYHPRPVDDHQRLLYRWICAPKQWSRWTKEERAVLPVIAAYERFKHAPREDLETLAEAARTGQLPWEMVIARLGNCPEAWRLVLEHLPVMALIRNLRNLHIAGVLADRSALEYVLGVLGNPEIIRQSRQLPFRWLAAWREVAPLHPELGRALEGALELSVVNMPHWSGTTAIACDNSGSMLTPLGQYSAISARDLANLLGTMIAALCDDGLFFLFGSIARRLPDPHYLPEAYQHYRALPLLQRFARVNTIGNTVGASTQAYKVLAWLLARNITVDRLVYLTDMQIYGNPDTEELLGWIFPIDNQYFPRLIREYRRRINPRLQTIIINLQPYDQFLTPQTGGSTTTRGTAITLQPEDDCGVTYVAGWSESLLGYISMIDQGGWSLVEEMNRISL